MKSLRRLGIAVGLVSLLTASQAKAEFVCDGCTTPPIVLPADIESKAQDLSNSIELNKSRHPNIYIPAIYSCADHVYYFVDVPNVLGDRPNYSLDRMATELSDLTGQHITWKQLYKQNKEKIPNPNVIQPGLNLSWVYYDKRKN